MMVDYVENPDELERERRQEETVALVLQNGGKPAEAAAEAVNLALGGFDETRGAAST